MIHIGVLVPRRLLKALLFLLLTALVSACSPSGATPSHTPPASAAVSTPLPQAEEVARAVFEAVAADTASRIEVDHPLDGLFQYQGTVEAPIRVSLPSRFRWHYADTITPPAGTTRLRLETADGSTSIRCFDKSELVEVRQGGQAIWLTATSDDIGICERLLPVADAALQHTLWDVAVDGALTNHQAVATQFAAQVAANHRAAPSWSAAYSADIRLQSNEVYDSYFGRGENFCALVGFWIRPGESGLNLYWKSDFQLGQQGEDVLSLHRNLTSRCRFRRNDRGDWVCVERTAGECRAEFPVPPAEATFAQLAEYFTVTAGISHNDTIPWIMAMRATTEPEAFLSSLQPLYHYELAELLGYIGYHTLLYHGNDVQYREIQALLPEPWQPLLEQQADPSPPLSQ